MKIFCSQIEAYCTLGKCTNAVMLRVLVKKKYLLQLHGDYGKYLNFVVRYVSAQQLV